MKMNILGVAVAAVVASAMGACGGGTSNSTAADAGKEAETLEPGVDAGAVIDARTGSTTDATAEAEAEAGVDHGAPSATYPAFKPDVGSIQNNMGLVMTDPVIVPITWSADPSQSLFQAFSDTVGATAYWAAAATEYGVKAAVSGAANHVSFTTTAPASISDCDLQSWVTTNAGAAGTGWPAATQNTIYAFFLPPGTSLNLGQCTGPGSGADAGAANDACTQGVGGYHSQVTVGSVTTSYAVVPSCTFKGSPATAQQQSTESMSHELLEAVTDPHPNDNNPGWIGFDTDHFAYNWFFEFQNTENGDACEVYSDSFFEDKETTPAPFDYFVQRTWSNKPGPLGHDPCVPAPADPYFNVAVLNLSEVTLSLPPQLTGMSTTVNQQVKGVHIPVGKSGVIELGFFSDGPTSGPMTISWKQGSPFNPTAATYLDATIDKTSGVNGEKAYVTVTPNAAGKLAGELLWIDVALGGVKHIMPIVISSYESD